MAHILALHQQDKMSTTQKESNSHSSHSSLPSQSTSTDSFHTAQSQDSNIMRNSLENRIENGFENGFENRVEITERVPERVLERVLERVAAERLLLEPNHKQAAYSIPTAEQFDESIKEALLGPDEIISSPLTDSPPPDEIIPSPPPEYPNDDDVIQISQHHVLSEQDDYEYDYDEEDDYEEQEDAYDENTPLLFLHSPGDPPEYEDTAWTAFLEEGEQLPTYQASQHERGFDDGQDWRNEYTIDSACSFIFLICIIMIIIFSLDSKLD